MANIHQAAWAIDLWEKIVEAPKGLRLTFPTRKAAIASRFSLYTARNQNREASKEIYHPETPEWGTSPWDAFRLTIEVDEKGSWVLIVSRHADAQFTPSHIEEI